MIISISYVIYVFYDIKHNDKDKQNYYKHVNSCSIVWNKTSIGDNFICIKRGDFYNQIPFNHKVPWEKFTRKI